LLFGELKFAEEKGYNPKVDVPLDGKHNEETMKVVV